MIPRLASTTLERLRKGFPVLVVTGPRQSGKTTLVRSHFSDKPYVSLENPQERDFAQTDPKRFLERFADGAIIDEVQRCPDLLSWLQQMVDERRRMGDFVLTGSAQLDLMAGVTQSLAGRVGRVELLPLSGAELTQAGLQAESLDDCLLQGGYPALYDRHLSADDWFASYVSTYLERDVRQLIAVRDLSLFQRFVRMCAARSGQLLNLSALAADCGVTAVTAKQWLSVLQTSYLVTTIAPYHRNFGKRLVKSPKLYFLDVGLMAWLLGIRDAQTLGVHSLRGELFETWVVSEMLKAQLNQGRHSDLFFWRDNVGTEVDAVYERNVGGQTKLVPVEIKSGSTFASDWLRPVQKWQAFANQTDPETTAKPVLIYGGEGDFERQNCRLIGWREFAADGVPS